MKFEVEDEGEIWWWCWWEEDDEDEDMEEDETKGGGLIKLFMFHQLGLPAAIICCTGELCNTPLFILFSLLIDICMYVFLLLDLLL